MASRFRTDIKKSNADRKDDHNYVHLAAIDKQKESITTEFMNQKDMNLGGIQYQ